MYTLEIRDNLNQEAEPQLISFSTGIVLMRTNYIEKYDCSMDLTLIPYDVQTCTWTVTSRWPFTVVSLQPWYDSSLIVGYYGLSVGNITNKEWDFTEFTTRKEVYNDGSGFEDFETAVIVITMDRRAYWYTVNLVIPSMLMWLLSYGSLWVNPDAAPARVALIVLPILILITLWTRAFTYLPIISQSTWLTDFVFWLLILCCVNFVEYVILHTALRVNKLRQTKAEELAKAAEPIDDVEERMQLDPEMEAWHTWPPTPSDCYPLPVNSSGNGNGNTYPPPPPPPETAPRKRASVGDRLLQFGVNLDVASRVLAAAAFIGLCLGFYCQTW